MRNYLEAKHETNYDKLTKRKNKKYNTAKTNTLASSSNQCTESDLKQCFCLIVSKKLKSGTITTSICRARYFNKGNDCTGRLTL